jgi:predicted amidophosphoribosyltransferase
MIRHLQITAMLKQLLLSPQCLQCASWEVQRHLFCKKCYAQIILRKLIKNHDFLQNNKHVFLIPWCLNDLPCIDQLVYRLKNLQSKPALEFYAERIILILQTLNLQNTQNILIPIPSSRKNFNHAHALAKFLSRAGFGIYCDILVKNGDQQKHLSRRLRGGLGFSIKPEYEDFTRNLTETVCQSQQVLFIDDVLTTGESFKSCSALLEAREKALCVTLFYREKA